MATTMNHNDFVARLVSGKEVFLKRNLCCVTFSVVLLSLVPDLFVPPDCSLLGGTSMRVDFDDGALRAASVQVAEQHERRAQRYREVFGFSAELPPSRSISRGCQLMQKIRFYRVAKGILLESI